MNQINQDLLNIWTRQLDIIHLDIQNEPVKPGFGSCQYLALDGVYHPLWAAFSNNPTPRTFTRSFGSCISSRITTVIQVGLYDLRNHN